MSSRTAREIVPVVAMVAAFAFLASVVGTRAAAQTAVLAEANVGHAVSGTIADGEGNPIGDAQVELRRGDSTIGLMRTDSTGRFRFESLSVGAAALSVRRQGFQVRVVPVNVVSNRITTVFVKLEESVASIDGMTVDGEGEEQNTKLREFYARAQGGSHFGYYIDEQQLEKMHPEQTSDALRAVPGVLVRPARIGNTVKIRGCSPLVWVDGLRAPNDELDDLTRGADVAAIEIYTSQAGVPAQYTDRTATCGTILVWLKSE
jgi:hypothetical protein